MEGRSVELPMAAMDRLEPLEGSLPLRAVGRQIKLLAYKHIPEPSASMAVRPPVAKNCQILRAEDLAAAMTACLSVIGVHCLHTSTV